MRAWIIGNGPSLNLTNLELLAGEATFAVGRIHLIYPKTAWRPTYYVRTEGNAKLISQHDEAAWREDIIAQFKEGAKCYLSRGERGFTSQLRKYQAPACQENYVETCAEHTFLNYDQAGAPGTWHLPELCGFGSSLHVAMQIAVKMGYGPLYLVGCDLGYKDGKPSHFDPEYEKGVLRPAKYANGNCLWAHNVAFRSCPVPVYNATIGGKLDVYPRVKLEDVLCQDG